jgi:hypothetical protein
MSVFELNYSQEISYNEKVELEVKLKVKPTKVDMDAMLDALDTIQEFADKYLTKKIPAFKVENK